MYTDSACSSTYECDEFNLEMYRDKGFTLIELVIVMGLIVLISGWSFMSVKMYQKDINRTEAAYYENMIVALIDNGKQYCRCKMCDGKVIFDCSKSKVIFSTRGNILDTINLPKNYTINNLSTSDRLNEIDIDDTGYTSDACTISFEDAYGEIHSITISVGVNNVKPKE